MTPANDPHALLYTQLDPEEAKALTTRLLGDCDDGELYLQFMASESFAFDDGRLKTADYSRDSGFGQHTVVRKIVESRLVVDARNADHFLLSLVTQAHVLTPSMVSRVARMLR